MFTVRNPISWPRPLPLLEVEQLIVMLTDHEMQMFIFKTAMNRTKRLDF
jgi:hypothetical protein